MPPKTTPDNPNQSRRKHRRRGRPPQGPEKVNVQAEEWGASGEPWPSVIDESDISKEIISVWRQNVYEAENGGEVQKMEDLYDRLDREREKWNKRLNDPLTWGWGGEPDELNDWARHSTNDVVDAHEPPHWEEHRPARSDKTQDDPPSARNPEQIPPPLFGLVCEFGGKLNEDGRERSYAFAQLSTEAKAEKIREVAYQLTRSLKR